MSLLKKTSKKRIADSALKKENQLSLEVKIALETTGEYSSDRNTVASIELNELLVGNSDTLIRALKNEVESIIAEGYEKAEKQIDNSEFLSDGYHAEKREQEDVE